MRVPIVLAVICTASLAEAKPPKIDSQAAIVMDVAGGTDVYDKHADDERPIGSMTKIFVALVLRAHDLDLTAWTTINDDDKAESEGGARERLDVGETFKNIDLLRAMLMVSDNRAPTALARSVGLDRDQLVAEMNATAQEMGLEHTHFTDPTGMDGNQSTPREIARALEVTLDDPLLAAIMRTRKRRIVSQSGKLHIDYRSSVQPLHDQTYQIYGGKTGHTESAGYCMIIDLDIEDHEYVMAFLGGDAKTTRFTDFDTVAEWIRTSR